MHEWDSKLGNGDMEENRGGENMEKTKEPGNIASDGVEQQTWNRKVKLVEKQTVRKDENTTRKDRSEERRNTRKDGMKFKTVEKRTPKKPVPTPIQSPRMPSAVTETRTRDPSSGRLVLELLCKGGGLMLAHCMYVFIVK